MGWIWPCSRLGPGIPRKLPGICLSPLLLTLLTHTFSSETDLGSTRPPCSVPHKTRGRERTSPSSPGKGLRKTGVGSGWCHVCPRVHDGRGCARKIQSGQAQVMAVRRPGSKASVTQDPQMTAEFCGFSRGNEAKEVLPPARTRSPCYNQRAPSETAALSLLRMWGS